MKTLTVIICPGETKRWLVAYNLETGATSQGKMVEEALKTGGNLAKQTLEPENSQLGFRLRPGSREEF